MKRFLLGAARGFGRGLRAGLVAIGALAFSGGVIALANYAVTVGSGTNFGSIVIGGVHFASMLICDMTTANQCATVSAGGSVHALDDNSAAMLAAVQGAIPAGINNIGKIDVLGNAGAIMDFAGQNATSPANAMLHGCQFNTSPTTISSGNVSPCQMDSAGNQLVNIKTATVGDPCTFALKTGKPFSITSSTQIITGTSAKKTYICAIDVVSATAQNIALVEGTGTVCATNIYGLAGGTTAATGWNLTANGIARGASIGTVYSPDGDTNAAAANVCLLLSGSGQTSGQIVYVQQ